MNNKEIFQTLSSTFAGILNNETTPKEANLIVIDADKKLKRQQRELSEFSRCAKIANKRNEEIVTLKEGLFTLYGISAINNQYYFKSGVKPKQTFTINEIEYSVFFKSEDF